MVVGGGISGLAAAHFFRQARPDARVLVLDNHDDFGGHAKRNEFTHNGRTFIGYGGTQSIDSPAPYSAVARALIADLGIDVARYPKVLDAGLYKSLGLRPATFFDKETFGADRLVVGDLARGGIPAPRRPSATACAAISPGCSPRTFDPMPGLSSAEKKARLARMSYRDFVINLWKLDPGVLWRLPDPAARAVRRRRRRGAGAGRLRPRLPRLCRDGPRCRSRPRTELRHRSTTKRPRTTTSTSPTATPRSRGCSCAARPRRHPRLDRWTTS